MEPERSRSTGLGSGEDCLLGLHVTSSCSVLTMQGESELQTLLRILTLLWSPHTCEPRTPNTITLGIRFSALGFWHEGPNIQPAEPTFFSFRDFGFSSLCGARVDLPLYHLKSSFKF